MGGSQTPSVLKYVSSVSVSLIAAVTSSNQTMQKFYLKIKKREVNHERRSFKEKGTYTKKGAVCVILLWTFG